MVIQEKYDSKEHGGQNANAGSQAINAINEIKTVYKSQEQNIGDNKA